MEGKGGEVSGGKIFTLFECIVIRRIEGKN